MNNVQIIEKAIEKALTNNPVCFGVNIELLSVYMNGCILMVTIEVTGKDGLVDMLDVDYFSIIYDHRFAKAFWRNNYEYHLQNMVIHRNPSEYLERFL